MKLLIIAVAAALTGCATNNMGAEYRPIVDLGTKTQGEYDKNLSECQAYARQVKGAADQAAAGAVAGALFGTLLAAAGGARGYRNEYAAVGALNGLAAGAVHGNQSQQSIISKCLAGRGFSVLN